MNEVLRPWIRRKIADEIYSKVITYDDSAVVYAVQAPAGMGKTVLARDIGTRLGSATGYEPVRQRKIAWSGILDIYDPDTNSNRGIERRLIQALSPDGSEFETYQAARELYDAWFKGGIVGAGLEEQRRKVETAFAEGLQEVSKRSRPVLVFDTTERLESASDPTQRELGFFDDTASVMGWLIFQIGQLRSGVVLLLGRRAERFYQALERAIEQANRDRPGLAPIELRRVDLTALDAGELRAFFANRMELYPDLTKLLDDSLMDLLSRRTEGHPLLLDLALQALLETADPAYVRQALAGKDGVRALERALVEAYMNSLDTDRQALLRYLALARNGLFADLLRALEPQRADRLIERLVEMESLPFIKVRNVSVAVPGSEERVGRRTYFLHDAMYTICDEVLLRPHQVVQDSERIVAWYERRIRASEREERRRPGGARRFAPDPDLLVESLFYRMRADPVTGYQWYLQQADRAIRSAETGLDMRLRDAMALFLVSASPEDEVEPGQSLSSPIDRANVEALMPELFDDFRLDSATLWIKRYTIRGKLDLAERIGREVHPLAEEALRQDPERYRLPLAEFLLWYGQTVMYGYNIEEALKIYHQVLDTLGAAYSEEAIEEARRTGRWSDFALWRSGLVLGRTYNNMGYTHWMYQGQYSHAVREFQQATRLFRTADLDEERANSSDNMGRVYALLGREFQATQLIRNGLEMRKALGLTYREALSANSLALVLLRFGQFELALRVIEDALTRFRLTGVERGIGLGLLTRGMVYRSLAEMWREMDIPLSEALRYTDLAETDLRDAVRIFSISVKEPVREVQAHNEMACCYRARYLLLAHSNAAEAERGMAFAQGRLHFRQAIETAKRYGYIVDELDSLQDMAVLLVRAGRYDDAERYLKEIRERIPDSYKIQPGRGLVELEEAERVDAYYKLMGQVELLAGAIEFERGRIKARQQGQRGDIPTREALLDTAHRYLLAISYFNRYSGETFAHRLTYARIYKRFQGCDPDLVREITKEHLPRWVKEYNLPGELVRGLFRDVFGLFD